MSGAHGDMKGLVKGSIQFVSVLVVAFVLVGCVCTLYEYSYRKRYPYKDTKHNSVYDKSKPPHTGK